MGDAPAYDLATSFKASVSCDAGDRTWDQALGIGCHMMHIQPFVLLTIGAILLLASPASAAWVCTARNDAGQKWTITRVDRVAAATTARRLCVARGASGNHCIIGCQGGGWSA
jgi:hypothetical protein